MMEQITQISSVFLIPALAYIVLLERRITTMQVQISMILKEVRGNHGG